MKEPLPHLLRQRAERPPPINSLCCPAQKSRIQVGRQDIDLPLCVLSQDAPHCHRNRIRLLARAACSTPDAKCLLLASPVVHQFWQYLLLEDLEGTRVTIKVGL